MGPETRPRINITSRLTRGAPRVRAGSFCRAHSRGPSPGIARPGSEGVPSPTVPLVDSSPATRSSTGAVRTCRHCPRVMPWVFFNHPQQVVNRCDRSTDRADPHRIQDALDVPHPTLPHRRCARERLRHPPALRSLTPSQAGRLVPTKTASREGLGKSGGQDKMRVSEASSIARLMGHSLCDCRFRVGLIEPVDELLDRSYLGDSLVDGFLIVARQKVTPTNGLAASASAQALIEG